MRSARKPMHPNQSNALDSLDYTLARYAEAQPAHAFHATTREQAEAWQFEARKTLWRLLGGPPADDQRVTLNPRYGPTVKRAGHTRTPVAFATRKNLDAFGYLLVPDDLKPGEQRGAVLCLPGHGRGADDIVGLNEDGTERDHHDGYQHDFALQCVERGYVTLALEMLGFGHRRDAAARKAGAGNSSCQPAAGAALLLGETMAGWRTWDACCALDLLESRPEVDPKRLAVIGISGGGTVGLYTAALDERVQATVLSCSFCTFRDSIFSVSHCIDNYVPGILKSFEMADIAALAAPRGIFCENGDSDSIFPVQGALAAFMRLRDAFEVFEARERAMIEVNQGGHQFYGKGAFDALQAWFAAPLDIDS